MVQEVEAIRRTLDAMPHGLFCNMTELGHMHGLTREQVTRRICYLPETYHHRHKGQVLLGNKKSVAQLKGNYAS